MVGRTLLLFLVATMTACMKAPDPSAAGVRASDPHGGMAPFANSNRAPDLHMDWEVPPGWRSVPPEMSFFLAKWELPNADGGNCTVSNTSGGVQLNIDRWLAQFSVIGTDVREAADISELEGARYKTTRVTLAGTMNSTRSIGGGPPRENWMLAGAVMETELGLILVKAVGPQAILEPQVETLWRNLAQAKVHRGGH